MNRPAGVLRRLARWVRHWPDRRRHAGRRDAALSALARMARPRAILVICHGNICRSPYAALTLRRQLAAAGLGAIRVDSAGFMGPGRSVPEVARRVAEARGVDLAGHQSRLLQPGDLARHDLVIVMDTVQADRLALLWRPRRPLLVLGDLDPAPIETRAITDPVERPQEVFEAVYARIDRCLTTLAAALQRGGAA